MIDNKIIDELKNRGVITKTTEDYTKYEDLEKLKLHGIVNDIAVDEVYADVVEYVNTNADANSDDIVVDDDTE